VPWTAVGIAALAALAGLARTGSARRRSRDQGAHGKAGLLADSRLPGS
jgi:hypothetical protein